MASPSRLLGLRNRFISFRNGCIAKRCSFVYLGVTRARDPYLLTCWSGEDAAICMCVVFCLLIINNNNLISCGEGQSQVGVVHTGLDLLCCRRLVKLCIRHRANARVLASDAISAPLML